MNRSRVAAAAAASLLALTAVAAAQSSSAAPSPAAGQKNSEKDQPNGKVDSLRVATYNLSLNRSTEGQLVRDLSTPDNTQARNVAEVIQRTNPDVVLLNEFDYVAGGKAVDLFRDNYLERSQNGAPAVTYPYAYTAPVNTGVPSGFDLNNDGTVGGGDDAYGFGLFPGQYGMVVLSKYPIQTENVRTFQNFLWKDMPGNVMPTDWYSPQEQDIFRLSSKSHWDVPITVGKRTVHVLAAHPTPPTFDGPEDRNGRRNHDEIRFWADYITPGKGKYIYDDAGTTGGLNPSEPFVILGDYNADPYDGDSYQGAINQLLDNKRVVDPLNSSEGAVEASQEQGGANLTHEGDPKYDTADFADTTPGNLRIDYTLLSKHLRPTDAGVFWPVRSDPLWRLTGEYPFPTSDHRLVWTDVSLR
ncbi:endonuclease/exonuclease/phosphatase family protein [Knoellia remsis]|uniref:Endonuclease/exonuclease/phosphatase family protein n=1 Tax=Knoellia remsis TaxID=407159 RepID=A0A2T0U867_9MICO|nr:endonuclease/exonuclease/phosphatase family protein [Knoellia remsis]PRY54113.1 endonuclease/exonuclease/phosphatase family protein [Knoellia remsis]